jgi:hypothetical protein
MLPAQQAPGTTDSPTSSGNFAQSKTSGPLAPLTALCSFWYFSPLHE